MNTRAWCWTPTRHICGLPQPQHVNCHGLPSYIRYLLNLCMYNIIIQSNTNTYPKRCFRQWILHSADSRVSKHQSRGGPPFVWWILEADHSYLLETEVSNHCKLFLIILNDGWMVDLAMSMFESIKKFLVLWHSWHPWHPWVRIRSGCWKWNLKQIEAIPPNMGGCILMNYRGGLPILVYL